MTCRFCHGIHLIYHFRCFLSVLHTLIDNIQRQLAHMFLTFIFFLNVLNEFFALRTTTLIEARVDGKLIGVDQLCHRHTKQQRLTVTLRNAETAQQFGSYLACLVVCIQQISCGFFADSVVLCQLLLPVRFILTTFTIPRIAAPRLIPHPVTIQLLQSLPIRQLVCRVGPVPVRSLWIEVQSL